MPSSSLYQEANPYQMCLAKNLYVGGYPRFAVLVIPSWTTEWCMYCPIGKNVINVTLASEDFEAASKRKNYKPKVNEYQMDISPGMANSLDSLFLYSVASPRKDVDNKMRLYDGVTYTFMSLDIAAKCKSPEFGNAQKLVNIVERLARLVVLKDRESVEQMIPEIEALADSFRTLYRSMGKYVDN